jgi:hypothetical protein
MVKYLRHQPYPTRFRKTGGAVTFLSLGFLAGIDDSPQHHQVRPKVEVQQRLSS